MTEQAFVPGGDLDRRRVGIFLVVAFGIASVVGAAIYATGGLQDSPSLPGLPITLATALLASAYMFSPAVAHAVARVVTDEGWSGLLLSPRVREAWPAYLAAWLGSAALVALGAGAYFLVYPGQFQMAAGGGQVLAQVALGVTVGPAINTAFAFGEEFGWRAYLLPKLLPLGRWRGVVAHGAIWGVWHWPVVAMGYNYGTGYPGAPWLGLAAMVPATVALGSVLAWLTVRSRSVWPAALAHGTINALGGIGLLFVAGEPILLLGPIPVGVVAALPWAVAGVAVLSRPGTFPSA